MKVPDLLDKITVLAFKYLPYVVIALAAIYFLTR